MERALALAAGTSPHPNPRVGAVVVARDGSVLAEHAHEGPGTAHAEAAAVAAAGGAARDAIVYVTLEPCAHRGNTPPCAEQLIRAGVGSVVIGAIDPDARVNGRGVAMLRGAGIEVTISNPAVAEQVDPGYFHHRRTGRPRVTLKAAATIDGQVAAADATSRWITSADARADGHRLRAAADAVLVGAGTLREDDPSLTVRLEGYSGRQPQAVVVAGGRPLPADRKLYGRDPLVYAPAALHDPPPGITVVPAAIDEGTEVDFEMMLDDLGRRGVVDLLVEGGPTVAAALLAAGLVDRLIVYLGAKVAGGHGRSMFEAEFPTLAAARDVAITQVRRLGPDLRLDVELGATE
jgi:diaminohydroxyphosphoribosylaminopyrimidine deaminase/5-amino-6-(5-phosphoribosylamino)uracil reductase